MHEMFILNANMFEGKTVTPPEHETLLHETRFIICSNLLEKVPRGSSVSTFTQAH